MLLSVENEFPGKAFGFANGFGLLNEFKFLNIWDSTSSKLWCTSVLLLSVSAEAGYVFKHRSADIALHVGFDCLCHSFFRYL